MENEVNRYANVSSRVLRRRRARFAIYFIVGILALAVDVWTAVRLDDSPPEGDAKIYSRIAVNVLNHRVFSVDELPENNASLAPSIIRLPGYPLLLAFIYSIAGEENYTAVRAVQGALHFGAAVLASLLAFNWVGGRKRGRRTAAFWTFFLSAFCPFTVNYSAVLLTEVPTIFLTLAMMLAATYAIKADRLSRSILWWAVAGLAGGIVVEIRPDSGLFALGLGLTLVASALASINFRRNLLPTFAKGAAFALVFMLVLTPWTIRNERIFGLFQPLAPAHAEAPGEFVPVGYFHWLRTWLNDSRYVSPMLWDLEIHRINFSKIPASAFTNDEEKARVATLIDQYNNSDPDHPMIPKKPEADSDDNDDNDSVGSDDSADDKSDQNSDDGDDDEPGPADEELDLKITPEVDAEFEKIADERIANQPYKYYLLLPTERATSMWFDTHSDFYPFSGEVFPVQDMDSDVHQEIWLPLFAAGVWFYTLLAIAGVILMWASGWPRARIWILTTLLIAVPRIVFFGTLENPEPRYLMELFFLAAVLGGIALSRVSFAIGHGRFGLTIRYGRDRSKHS